MIDVNPLHRFASSPRLDDFVHSPAAPVTAQGVHKRVWLLEAFYRRVQAERMQGIPILNPALAVEAVGFELGAPTTEGEEPVAEGVLITPWFMSLVRLPLQAQPHAGRVGRKTVRDFGCERFDFIGGHELPLGYHETCALFSPMQGFASQDQARETALASLALLRPAPPAETPAPVMTEPVPARRAFLLARRTGGRGGAA